MQCTKKWKCAAAAAEGGGGSSTHSRDKRFIWMTEEKRLVLPPGTQLVLTPTLAMPLIRYPPHGMDANITISTPFTSKYFLVL